ncbi:hypothetical protein ASF27_12335 [Methylobacterium sp. Leaf102]|uniref:hypothetical protein n=1 Tax=Methylobacterium sp. Leaf102 TaxID=1736253 RepID=UPI0006FF8DCE|nr:hypothetical protein [Methylobacterium sp. Leaf102]KQP23947.1 hypothetical protein ASF27_12335 [Methylobacterium sp. Leaf102]
MEPANDAIHKLSDVARIRQSLRASVAKLMDAAEHLAQQIAALDAAERQVRALALRETSRVLDGHPDPDERGRLGTLQGETNANFQQMRAAYAELSSRIDALLGQHQELYDATFTPDTTDRS